ncbi:FixH family protein [Pleionea sediminis]|uniref:FixH family protein n=1 Tax=Pleionea sediminis TaxID=2569479 RepID=UPI0011864FBE|nr:FixH family protein [Pleionea sediminis]
MSEKSRNEQSVEDIKPWYKQFWPWFLIALPGSVVIAGISTVIIATKNADSLVKADYYKDGLAINESIDRQNKATELALEFNLSHSNKSVTLTSNKSLNLPIVYAFMQHPMDEKKDFTLAFTRTESGAYQTNDAQIESFNYRVRLYGPDKQWEILTRWNPVETPEVLIKAQ